MVKFKNVMLCVFIMVYLQEFLPFIFYALYDSSILDANNCDSFTSKFDQLHEYDYYRFLRTFGCCCGVIYALLEARMRIKKKASHEI